MSKVKQLAQYNGSSWVPYEIDASYLGGVAASTYSTHVSSKSNPHGVTKSQVGLGSVVNAGQSATYTSKLSSAVMYFTQNGAYNMYTALKAAIPTFSNGQGISIGTDGKISVKTGTGLGFDSNGNLIVTSSGGISADVANTFTAKQTFNAGIETTGITGQGDIDINGSISSTGDFNLTGADILNGGIGNFDNIKSPLGEFTNYITVTTNQSNVDNSPLNINYNGDNTYGISITNNNTNWNFDFEYSQDESIIVIFPFPKAAQGSQEYECRVIYKEDLDPKVIYGTFTQCNPAYSSAINTSKTTSLTINNRIFETGDLIRCYFRGGKNNYFYINNCVIEFRVQYLTYNNLHIYVGHGKETTEYYNVEVKFNNSVTTTNYPTTSTISIIATKIKDLAGAPNGVSDLYLDKIEVVSF